MEINTSVARTGLSGYWRLRQLILIVSLEDLKSLGTYLWKGRTGNSRRLTEKGNPVLKVGGIFQRVSRKDPGEKQFTPE